MFQINLEFNTENPVLPKEMDRLLVSFLKASTRTYSQEFFNMLYDKTKSIIKPFCFSYYLPGAKFQKDKIILDQNSFKMFFSNADLGQAIHFVNAFKLMKNNKYPMNGNSMNLVSIGIQKREKINDSEIVVKMQSSLIVRRHDSENNTDTYYTYEQDGFAQALKENTEIFLKRLNMDVSTAGFHIIPIKAKKVIVPVFGRNVDASLGIFKLTGSPELLNLLYLAGVGVRRSEGHGKFEVIW